MTPDRVYVHSCAGCVFMRADDRGPNAFGLWQCNLNAVRVIDVQSGVPSWCPLRERSVTIALTEKALEAT